MEQQRFNIIVIGAGGKDLEGTNIPPREVAEERYELAREFVAKPYPLVNFVTICQVVKRNASRNVRVHEYQERIEVYNNHLKKLT